MNQLEMPVSDLAERLGVSHQTVRHWLSGRSFPGKRKAPELERALSFKLDYSEGAGQSSQTVESALNKSDVETFLLISRLPPEVKSIFGRLASAFLQYGPSAREINETSSGATSGRGGADQRAVKLKTPRAVRR